MSAEEYTGPGLAMNPELFAILQTATDFSELQKSAGYRRLLGFLEAKSTEAGEALLNGDKQDDREQVRLVIAWREREKIIADIKMEIQRAISSARSVTRDLNVTTAQREGFALMFNGDDEQGD
jgi:hypothetical protein